MLLLFIGLDYAVQAGLESCITEEAFMKRYLPQHKSVILDHSKLEEVASGNYGAVFALPTNSGILALKRLKTMSASSMKDLVDEVDAGKKLQGVQGVVSQYHCIVGQKWAGIVMEKLHDTLFSAAGQILGLPFDKKLNVYAILASHTHQMHSRGFIHNDIKPMNVMITDAAISDLRFIDFGISCRIGQMCIGGTRELSPPEKLQRNLTIRGHYSIDTWGVLMSIVFTENRNEYSLLKKSIELSCKLSAFHLENCYGRMIGAVRSMLAKTQAPLKEYILKSLDRVPEKRPTPLQIFDAFRVMSVEAQVNENFQRIQQNFQ